MAIPLHELNPDGTLTLPVVSDAVAAGVGGGGGGAYVTVAAPVGVAQADAAAINTAIAALPARGGTVLLQAGIYALTSAITLPAGTRLLGMGSAGSISNNAGATQIAFSHATNNVFVVGGNDVEIGSMSICHQVTRTAGADVYASGAALDNVDVHDMFFYGSWNAYYMDGRSWLRLRNSLIRNNLGHGVYVRNVTSLNGNSYEIANCVIAGPAGFTTQNGIQIDGCSDIRITSVNVVDENVGLCILGTSTTTASNITVVNSFFANATDGILLFSDGSTNGKIENVNFVGCEGSGSNVGCSVNMAGDATTSNFVQFSGCKFFDNTTQGMQILACDVPITVTGSTAVHNGVAQTGDDLASGFFVGIAAAVPRFTFVGNTAYNNGNPTGPHGYGLYIGTGTFTAGLVDACNFNGNQHGGLSNNSVGGVTVGTTI